MPLGKAGQAQDLKWSALLTSDASDYMTGAELVITGGVAACLIPITAGGAGVLLGPAMVGIDTASIAAESHYRYLSGLLLSIGVLF